MFKNIFIINIVIAILYFIAGKLSFSYTNSHDIVTIVIFISEGIALASVLYFGKKILYGIFIGQFILAYTSLGSFIISFEISLVNTAEALLALYLFSKYKLNKNLLTLNDVIGLAVLIIFILQPFSSIFGNTILYLNNILPEDEIFMSLFSWWFGNTLGQLLFTPFILILLSSNKSKYIIQYILYSILFALFIYFLEVYLIKENLSLLLTFTIPIVIYAVSKNGLLLGTMLAIVISFVSTYTSFLGIGIFSADSTINSIININFFILAHLAIILISGTLFQEKELNELNLKSKVKKEVEKNRKHQLLMLEQNRLAQMGEMIAMIAHQWRQPLNNLSLINQLIINKYNKNKLDEESFEYFKINSQKQIKQMSSTIDDFRNFFKTDKCINIFDLNNTINDMISITNIVLDNNKINIEINSNKTYKIKGYQSEFGQAILNILNNAKDALINNNIENKSILIKLYDSIDFIKIDICDNAGGINTDIINNIFDPYFSTKKEKNGTGLGLYMSKLIIEEHMNGTLEVSNKNDGAVFTITLKKDTNETIK